jgi:ABC-type bacteriocin/lantibiotic exporter with double-glycine peptidase domain
LVGWLVGWVVGWLLFFFFVVLMVLCSWLLCFSFCVCTAVPVEIVFVWLGTVEKKEHSIRALTSDAQALNAQLLSTRKQHQKELQQRPQVNLIF